jgi:glycosyltransferase involved in cell wall biosynthesis
MKIAFVIPWYGKNAAGGAEAECRSLVMGLRDLRPDIEVEVLTTCLKEFAADWNENVHNEGMTTEDGVNVRRFKATKENRRLFGFINGRYLMGHSVADLWQGDRPKSPLWSMLEKYYIRRMIRSKSMVQYIKDHRATYDFFIFMPYMFGTTYFGSLAAGEKAIILPCLHNERYAFMDIYRKMMTIARACFYLVEAEKRLAKKLYNLPERGQHLLGAMVDTAGPVGDGARFRNKYAISDKFLLYAGRKVEGKNLPLLVERFKAFRQRSNHHKDLKLVIIGRGNLDYKTNRAEGIIDLGFVSAEDKIDAMAAADVFCMPSLNESFSIVLMEAWLQGAPALVHADCDVTREHCEVSGGGMAFSDQRSFDQHLESLLGDEVRRKSMGELGRGYVLANFTKEKIIKRFTGILDAEKSTTSN